MAVTLVKEGERERNGAATGSSAVAAGCSMDLQAQEWREYWRT